MSNVWTIGEHAKRKPVSVAVSEARYAIVGTYRRGAGVLCWTTNRTDAEAGLIWYEKHGGDARILTAAEART